MAEMLLHFICKAFNFSINKHTGISSIYPFWFIQLCVCTRVCVYIYIIYIVKQEIQSYFALLASIREDICQGKGIR